MEKNKGKMEPKRMKYNSHLSCTTSNFDTLIIRQMQIETTMRYHLTLARMIIIKKTTNKCW